MADPGPTEILTAVDERPGAPGVLRWAHAVARATDRPLRVLRSWEYPWVAGLPGVGPLPAPETIDDAVEADLRALAGEELGPDTTVEITVARGGAAQAVLAGAPLASLVVMGRRGEDDQPGWLGSVSRKVVERADAPVAVVPPEWTGVGLERIAVGVDFSEPSARAVRWAGDLAAATGGRVLAVHAVAPAVPGAGGADDADLAARTLAFCAEHASDGVEVEVVTDRRPPARAVTEVAEEQDADVVVVGRRGSGGLPRTILGSVAAYAARHATCPVVVVPS